MQNTKPSKTSTVTSTGGLEDDEESRDEDVDG
eukprot:CAMPEP_0178959692 /NCGR_PEP_ID=MMETSP0789-20121207/12455_1 /TAXON_ID=3005 /ORGANISM="Rhizosolenia setigera, Strain CCMP 1694" /LENGTH=31 /DNA_ID= /DNA_START= /DNA_END= /DNA_ORIENTATION=